MNDHPLPLSELERDLDAPGGGWAAISLAAVCRSWRTTLAGRRLLGLMPASCLLSVGSLRLEPVRWLPGMTRRLRRDGMADGCPRVAGC